MEVVQLTLPGELVKKDNQIVRNRTNITRVDQARIIAMLVACIRHDDVDFKETYSIAIKDFLPDESGRSYITVKQQCKDLASCIVEIENKEKGRDKNGFYPFYVMPFFTYIGYENGFVNARFNPEMKPYLLDLKGCFTKYNLLEYLSLPSTYSQKIFELLKSWANKPEFTLDIKNLHRILNTPPTFRKDFHQLKKRVLERAEKDINNKTELFFCWEAIKKGRSVVAVKFMFARKKDKEEELRKQKQDEESRINNKYAKLCIKCFAQKELEGKATKEPLSCSDKRPTTLKCKTCKRFYGS